MGRDWDDLKDEFNISEHKSSCGTFNVEKSYVSIRTDSSEQPLSVQVNIRITDSSGILYFEHSNILHVSTVPFL